MTEEEVEGKWSRSTWRRIELPGPGVHLQYRLGKMRGAKYIRRLTFQGMAIVGQALGGAGMTQGAPPHEAGTIELSVDR